MCRLGNIAMRDYQQSVTIGQTDTRTHRQTPDKVIPMCRYASQATQKSIGFTMVNMSAKFNKDSHNSLVCNWFIAYFQTFLYVSTVTLTFAL